MVIVLHTRLIVVLIAILVIVLIVVLIVVLVIILIVVLIVLLTVIVLHDHTAPFFVIWGYNKSMLRFIRVYTLYLLDNGIVSEG